MNRRFRLLSLFAAGLLGVRVFARDAAPATPAVQTTTTASADLTSDAELEKLLQSVRPTWTATASVHTSLGYKTNILLSSSQPADSAFSRSGLETLLWHVPTGKIDYFAFANADYTRYFKRAVDSYGNSVDHEAEAFAGLEWRFRQNDWFTFTLDAQGYFLDQLFDISNIIGKTSVEELKVKGGKVGPTVRWAPVKWAWIEGNAMLDRQRFAGGQNDARIREFTARAGLKPWDHLQLSVAATERRRGFERRVPMGEDGPLPGLLAIREREVEEAATLTFGHWTSTTRTGVLHYFDNAIGFLNYRQRHVAEEVEWSAGKWLVHAEGDASRKDYETQTVGAGIAPPGLLKDEFTTTLRIERKLSARWTVYTEYSWERSRSNDPIASYRMNEGLLGARWSWEK